VNNQNTEDHDKISVWTIFSTTFIIIFWFYHWDDVLYSWLHVDILRICFSERYQVFLWLYPGSSIVVTTPYISSSTSEHTVWWHPPASGSLYIYQHPEKCKSTIDCAMRTCTLAQLIASFSWTPARRAAYSRLYSIHRVVRVGLWNYIQLAAGDGLSCYTGTVHYRGEPAWASTWEPAWEPAREPAREPAWEPACKPAWKPLWKPAWEPSWESLASGRVEFSTGNFWPMENPEFVEALANGKL